MSFDSAVLSPRNPRSPDGVSLITTGNQLQLSTLNAIKEANSKPTNPTGTTSLTSVMMGLAVAFTPVKTGRVRIFMKLILAQNTTADGATWQISHGTGTAPVNGAAVTGTQDGQPSPMTFLTGVLSIPDENEVEITGLVLNTAIWIDIALKAVTGGTATVTGLYVEIEEF